MGPVGRYAIAGTAGVATAAVAAAATLRDPMALAPGAVLSLPGLALGLASGGVLHRVGLHHPVGLVAASAAVPAVAGSALYAATTYGAGSGDANIGAGIALLATGTGVASTVGAVSLLRLLH